MREVLLKVFQTSSAKIYVVVLGLISLTLTTRILGPEGRGMVVSVTTWITTFATVSNLSLGQVTIKNASQGDDESWLAKSLSVLILNTILMTCLCLLVYFLITFYKSKIFGDVPAALYVAGFTMLPFLIWDNYSNYLLMAANEVGHYNKSQVASRTIGLIFLLIFLLVFKLGPLSVITANALAYLLAFLLSISILVKKHKFSLPTRKTFIDYYWSGFTLHLNTIGTFIFTGADILMLNYFKGNNETGLYQLGTQLLNVMLIIPQSASMIIYSEIAKLGPDTGWENQKKLIKIVMIFIVFVSLLAGVTVDWWLEIIAGKEFNASKNLFKLQLVSLPLMSFCTLMGPQWISRGFFKLSSLSAVVLGLTNILGNKLLIPEWGMYGAVGSTLISFLLAGLLNVGLFSYCEKKVLKD